MERGSGRGGCGGHRVPAVHQMERAMPLTRIGGMRVGKGGLGEGGGGMRWGMVGPGSPP